MNKKLLLSLLFLIGKVHASNPTTALVYPGLNIKDRISYPDITFTVQTTIGQAVDAAFHTRQQNCLRTHTIAATLTDNRKIFTGDKGTATVTAKYHDTTFCDDGSRCRWIDTTYEIRDLKDANITLKPVAPIGPRSITLQSVAPIVFVVACCAVTGVFIWRRYRTATPPTTPAPQPTSSTTPIAEPATT